MPAKVKKAATPKKNLGGRPRMPREKKRDKVFCLALNAAQVEALNKTAKARGINVQESIRLCINAHLMLV